MFEGISRRAVGFRFLRWSGWFFVSGSADLLSRGFGRSGRLVWLFALETGIFRLGFGFASSRACLFVGRRRYGFWGFFRGFGFNIFLGIRITGLFCGVDYGDSFFFCIRWWLDGDGVVGWLSLGFLRFGGRGLVFFRILGEVVTGLGFVFCSFVAFGRVFGRVFLGWGFIFISSLACLD